MILSFLGEVHFLDEHRQQSVSVDALLGPQGMGGLGGQAVGFAGRWGREIDCRCGPQQRLAAACSDHLS